MRYYARKWLTILIVVLVGAILGIAYTYYIQQPQYKSTATLLVVGAERTSAQESVALNNYVQLFRSRRVLEPVISESKYKESYDDLANNTSAENVKNTDIINVSVTTTDARTSKQLLETAIRQFSNESKKLYSNSSVKINVVDVADVPSIPTNIKPLQQISLAVIAAFTIVMIVLFFVYDFTVSKKPEKKRVKRTPRKKKA